MNRALFEAWPELEAKIPWVALGDFPTPVEAMNATADAIGAPKDALFVKRDDLSAPQYGGNKIRTLEVLFARARDRGARRIYSTGAFGSNHACATVVHAERAELESGVILFPQPRSLAALENCRVILAARPRVTSLPHWSFLPFGMAAVRARERSSEIMVPGGATPAGALGYVSAALEVARQVEAGVLPIPRAIVVGVGSTCTSAGLLVGLRAAAALGIGWKEPPKLVSVRVTPWPVTSAYRIVGLAVRTAERLAELTGQQSLRYSDSDLRPGLEVDGHYLGGGYGVATEAGRATIATVNERDGLLLDTTYSAKAAAAALDRAREGRGPILFWSTKSTAPLPAVTHDDWAWAPSSMTRWIERAERDFPPE